MMKLLVLFVTILVASSFSLDLEEENEASLCVEHQNPFAYTHCIKKRDTACQNGGFCGTCNSNTCQGCNGNSCKTFCNGAACNQCPTGNCCDGQNCNVCHGRNCCNSNSCNSCVNTCNEGCSTLSCRSSCFQNCQGNSCCDRSECFNTCRNQCIGDHCYESCFKQCSCPQTCNNPPSVTSGPIFVYPNISYPPPPPPQRANQTIVVVSPEKTSPINITTIVNLKNYINNKNVITTPVNITNLNHNHIHVNRSSSDGPRPVPVEDKKCCIVVYPVHCYDITEAPYKKCIQKREEKCGEICTSVVVHVVHVPGKDKEVPVPYPVPVQVPGPVQIIRQPQPYPIPVIQRYPYPVYTPQVNQWSGGAVISGGYKPLCHYRNRYPWVSCSNHYGTQSCGSCYVCGGQYNPGICSQQLTCANLCRGGIVNFGENWQNDILKFAPAYGASYPSQYQSYSGQQLAQNPGIQQSVDLAPQAYAQQSGDLGAQQQIVQQPNAVDYGMQQQYVQQPVGADLGMQQQYVQQPMGVDLGLQQQYMQQAAGLQQPVGLQQQLVQQPFEMQQGAMQQYVAQQQPYEIQLPLGGQQQQVAVQSPYEFPSLNVGVQDQSARHTGK